MIVLILALILTGSISGAAILWAQDASFWGIALGYVAGGWAGLLLGTPMVMMLCALGQRGFPRRRSWGAELERQHPSSR